MSDKKDEQKEVVLTREQALIIEQCDKIKALLLQKNREYGNAALAPKRIFSRSSNIEQLKVRIDDKLSRIANDEEKNIKEDTVDDLTGYLILYKVAQRLNED